MFSHFLKKPFEKAIEAGLIPPHLNTIAGTCGAMHDSGELTHMTLLHLSEVDGTDPDSMTKGEIKGRRQAMLAIEALRRFMPGCDGVRLRNIGRRIGIRDTRKIKAAYGMTETDVRREARFEDNIGIYPEFTHGYGVLIIASTGRHIPIPYRAMLPGKVKGLLVAGRAMVVDAWGDGDKTAKAEVPCNLGDGRGKDPAPASPMVHRVGHVIRDHLDLILQPLGAQHQDGSLGHGRAADAVIDLHVAFGEFLDQRDLYFPPGVAKFPPHMVGACPATRRLRPFSAIGPRTMVA
jgi:hypothetical protein